MVELIGNTVFFVRKENNPRETIDGIRGYGHAFPAAYTTWEGDVKGSESHQRIIQYKFGELNCIVRFECDGYLGDSTATMMASSITGGQDLGDELVHALGNMFVGQQIPTQQKPLIVLNGGSEVSQASLFDLKTRSGRYKTEIPLEDYLPQLYLKQIPNFVTAYHDGAGTFPHENIKVRNIQQEVHVWEIENRDALNRLATLLRKISAISKEDETGMLEVYSPCFDRLEIRRQYRDGSHALPPNLKDAWGKRSWSENDDSLTFEDARVHADGGGLLLKDHYGHFSDSESEGSKDFTACSAESCGYCGKCSY
jgi:hypothetical protein